MRFRILLFLLFQLSFLIGAFTREEEIEKPFAQGVIHVKISTPGNMIGTLMAAVDPSKGNPQQQMESIMSKWSAAEKKKYQSDIENSGMLMLALAAMPMKCTIWSRDAQATAKFDAVNYHGETRVDGRKQQGMMFLQSNHTSKALSIQFTGDELYNMASQVLTNQDYHIQRTKETSLIAGYNCTKSVYTLKSNGEAAPGQLDADHDSKAWRVEVWTSQLMPKTLNFLHPLYIEEEAGIMKILVTYDKKASLKLQYEFTGVEEKPVADTDLSIKKSDKIYNHNTELLDYLQDFLSITTGAGNPE